MFREQNKNINEQDIEHLPVYTMMKDLEFINNPEVARKNEESENAPVKKPVSPENLTAAQKSSPFLNPVPTTGDSPIPPKKEFIDNWTDKTDRITISEKTPVLTDQAYSSEKSSKKPLLIILSVLLIFVIAGSGYYFWTAYQRTLKVVETTPITEPEPTPQPEPQPEPTITFSTDKPNYLSIDLTQGNNTAVKDALKNYLDKVSKSGITTPIEFAVTDTQNNPLKFSSFANSLGLKLSSSAMSSLAETFSLFIYNDQGNMRLGLSIDIKNDTLLKTVTAKEEPVLVSEIAPLFMDVTYTATATKFGKSTYAGADIRYINVISPQDLSVDYTIFEKKLLIGTTKMTLRSMIDYLSAKQPTPVSTTPATTGNPANTGSPDINQLSPNPPPAQ